MGSPTCNLSVADLIIVLIFLILLVLFLVLVQVLLLVVIISLTFILTIILTIILPLNHSLFLLLKTLSIFFHLSNMLYLLLQLDGYFWRFQVWIVELFQNDLLLIVRISLWQWQSMIFAFELCHLALVSATVLCGFVQVLFLLFIG